MAIHFYLESERIRLKQRKRIKAWLKESLRSEGKCPGIVTIVLANDNTLLELNKEYLSKNHYTDVITFDYSEGDKISGDIYVSVDRVVENASKYKVPVIHELYRVMIHGILHMVGYKDDSVEGENEMRRKEDQHLKKIL